MRRDMQHSPPARRNFYFNKEKRKSTIWLSDFTCFSYNISRYLTKNAKNLRGGKKWIKKFGKSNIFVLDRSGMRFYVWNIHCKKHPRSRRRSRIIYVYDRKAVLSDEYCQDGFSNGTVNTLQTSWICSDFRAKMAWNQVRKINACGIREVSAVCAYGLHHSAIHGIVHPVRGFAWPFAVWLVIVRFREVQRCILRTGHRISRLKPLKTQKHPAPCVL